MERTFLRKTGKRFEGENLDLINRALAFAKEAHREQKRLTGEDYIVHPIQVASVINEIRLDAKTIAAGLLHDVLEENKNISSKDLEKQFGEEIAFLVNGVSKLEKLPYGVIEKQAENLRKLMLATAQDLRVILIKLADRLDNLKSLDALPKEKQKRIALETIEIYAPIAYRLGMGEMRGQLEDLAFPYLYPQEYQWLMENVKEKYEARKKYIDNLTPKVSEILTREGIKVMDTHSRAKHYYSLWHKLKSYEMNLNRIYDLVALRILVPDIDSCYASLGILHRLWKPLPGRIKDYIALPKPNGYRSLHTTVFCEDGKITEFQIRTLEMHEEAEYGIAAHWIYKNGKNIPKKDQRNSWIKQLQEWQTKLSNTEELLESLKIDFFKNRIFVFTPKGDVIDLPEGATPVDFAFHIHSRIGEKCRQAFINGKMASLDTKLQSGDMVEVITKKDQKPSRDWLGFVKTNLAKSHIKKFLRESTRGENIKVGLELINGELKSFRIPSFEKQEEKQKEKILTALKYKNTEDLLFAVGCGELNAYQVTKLIVPESRDAAPSRAKIGQKELPPYMNIKVGGQTGVLIQLARCCNPLAGEPIEAVLTKNHGAKIHKHSCKNLARARKSRPEKTMPAFWQGKPGSRYPTTIMLVTMDRVGLIQDISSTISNLGINIMEFLTTSDKENANLKLTIEVNDLDEEHYLISRLKKIDGVLEVQRD